MMIERQVSVFAAAVGVALALPQYQAMARGAEGAPSIALAIGVLFGAMGAFLGGAVVAGWDNRVLQVLGMTFWTALGLGFGGVSVMGALHSASWVGHLGFAVLAVLPVAGPAWILVRLIQESRRPVR